MANDGKSTSWDVKQYLQPIIQKMRVDQKLTWPQVQKALGPYAWNVWLMVENVPNPNVQPPTTARQGVVSGASLKIPAPPKKSLMEKITGFFTK